MTDPFADPFASPVSEAPTTTPSPLEDITVTANADANYTTVILKGGKGYGAPSISIRGESIADALKQMKDHEKDLQELVRKAATFGLAFGTLVDGTTPAAGGNGGGQPGKPAGATQAPSGETAPTCKHGAMEWRSWVRASDSKAFKGFFCTERDRDSQCKAEFRK
jgi:hypothetical protein